MGTTVLAAVLFSAVSLIQLYVSHSHARAVPSTPTTCPLFVAARSCVPVQITVSVLFEREHKYVLELHLAEVRCNRTCKPLMAGLQNIVPEETTATLLSTKVDIKMKKVEDKAWPQLAHKD